ncbi:MAG: hypothetical protein RR653_05725, partial [Clostridia bacterium]
MRNWHTALLRPPAGESPYCGIGIPRCCTPAGGNRPIAEMAFRAAGVGTAPHTGTYSFGAKEYAENSGTH